MNQSSWIIMAIFSLLTYVILYQRIGIKWTAIVTHPYEGKQHRGQSIKQRVGELINGQGTTPSYKQGTGGTVPSVSGNGHEAPSSTDSPLHMDHSARSTATKGAVTSPNEAGNVSSPKIATTDHRPEDHQKDQLTILSVPYAYAIPCSKTENKRILGCEISGGKSCLHVCDPDLYNVSDVVIYNLCSHREFLPYRPPNQKWTYVELEAPPTSRICWPKPDLLDQIKGAFNITASFTSDADVPVIIPNKCTFNNTKLEAYKQKYMDVDFLAGRSRNVIWFNSHCETQSQREDYVAELTKYIDVDIYGKCGHLICGSRSDTNPACATELLNSTYRFFLSFENSLCEDYLTEKLGRIMDHGLNIIPIVLGLANYTNLYPDRTYIDVEDYKSPKDLAEYLYQVGSDNTLYNEYIHRKNSLDCVGQNGSFLCRLCRYAHAHQGEVQTLPDVTKFWSMERRCATIQDHLPNAFIKPHA